MISVRGIADNVDLVGECASSSPRCRGSLCIRFLLSGSFSAVMSDMTMPLYHGMSGAERGVLAGDT